MNTSYTFQKLSKISKKYPNLIAIKEPTKDYTYKTFFDMVSNISDQILLKKKNSISAIIGEKDILSYVSIFGVLKSGGTYIPISSNMPTKRIIKIISKGKANIIICNSGKVKFYKKIFPKKIFFTEKNLSAKKNNYFLNPKKVNNLAYIIFTSGSTGEPKGVCISRKSLDHYVKWLNTNFNIKKGYNCSQFPEISFDLSVADIYGTLSSGGTLVPAKTIYDKLFPGRFIRNKKIDFLVCVPSLIDVIKNSSELTKQNLKSLKTIFFCGEALLKTQVKSILKVKKNLRIINAYGPTEATVSCTHKEVRSQDLNNKKFHSISIGSAIPGTKIKLLDNGKFSKNKGEIIIYGNQVAEGYLNKKENKNKFFLSKKDKSLFKTGDYVEIFNNEMFFKNRVDNQVKIKGHRIELDEISSCLMSYGIKKINTIVFNKKIVSFYTDKKKYNKNTVDVFLKKNIPEYMIPNYLFQIKKFPLTENLKLNIKGLIQIAKKKINAEK